MLNEELDVYISITTLFCQALIQLELGSTKGYNDIMKNAIKISRLTKQFGKKAAVNNVSFDVKEGEIFGFLGPNGAGKTTTIRLMLNHICPTAGRIHIYGKDSVQHYVEVHAQVGYLAGDMALYDGLSGWNYVKYIMRLHGQTDMTEVNRLADVLKADLKPKIKNLSRGNKQKIGIIAALAHQPKLLILDEPTTGLDPLMQEVFYSLLREHKKRGGTTFMSSHNLAEVEKVCDRVGFIREGKLAEVSSVRELRQAATKEFHITLASTPNPAHFRGMSTVRDLRVEGKIITCSVRGRLNELVRVLSKYDVVNIESRELDLEEVFMKLYGKGGK